MFRLVSIALNNINQSMYFVINYVNYEKFWDISSNFFTFCLGYGERLRNKTTFLSFTHYFEVCFGLIGKYNYLEPQYFVVLSNIALWLTSFSNFNMYF